MGTKIDITQVPPDVEVATTRINELSIIPDNGHLFPLVTNKAYFGTVLYSPTAIFKDGTTLRKYVAIYGNGTYNFVAYSDDGYAWNNEAQITGTNTGYHATTILVGTTIHLFYWDTTANLYSPAAVRHATIDITTNCSIAVTDIALSGTYITGNDADGLRYGCYGIYKTFYNASPTNNPANPYSYAWCAIHSGTNGNDEGLLFAVSSDGYNFSAWNGLTEVISRAVYPLWDVQIGALDVWMQGASWYMLYSAGVGTSNGSDSNFADGIGYATSTDGITWVKSSANPTMFKTMAYKTALRLYCPSVVKEDDGLKLYYTAKSSTDLYRISKATINRLM